MVKLNRRGFLGVAGAGAALSTAAGAQAAGASLDIPDEGWNLWIDEQAAFKDDVIYLPSQVNLKALPVNPPTGGWGALRPEVTVT